MKESSSQKRQETQETPDTQGRQEKQLPIKRKISNVTKDQLETYKVIHETNLKKQKTDTVLEVWRNQQDLERNMRKIYARWILIALVAELIVGNGIFILVACGVFTLEEWVVNVFFTGMYAQIISITVIVVRNLFPNSKENNIIELNQVIKDI
ncbi:hypothetical protein [Halobacillus trueperi]|uniref:Uncharacterized protein n=1 Tax=Halobacillus trueperi TaxID=156205 RepID=A0A3E0J276_9BACI|nr:hypothetical protein [Halobacillus trueperi]REJ06929.1 hypothetical protein DYE48_17505 [Halobacillus trueperi]